MENANTSDQDLSVTEDKLAKAIEALQVAKSLIDTPIGRRRLNLDPDTDPRLLLFRKVLQELDI